MQSLNSSPQCKKSSLHHHFRRNSWKLGSQKLLAQSKKIIFQIFVVLNGPSTFFSSKNTNVLDWMKKKKLQQNYSWRMITQQAICRVDKLCWDNTKAGFGNKIMERLWQSNFSYCEPPCWSTPATPTIWLWSTSPSTPPPTPSTPGGEIWKKGWKQIGVVYFASTIFFPELSICNFTHNFG